MLLRPAEPADAMGVALVHVRAWQVGYRKLLPDDYLDGLKPEDRARRYTFGGTDPREPMTTVAVDDAGIIRGFATTCAARDADAPGHGELAALYVDPDCWGRGIGQALLASARAHLLDSGFRRALLWVLVGNLRTERIYVSDGWAPDGSRRKDLLWGIEVEDQRYRRTL
jgi:GNAT superfamily N-acetyltransferase